MVPLQNCNHFKATDKLNSKYETTHRALTHSLNHLISHTASYYPLPIFRVFPGEPRNIDAEPLTAGTRYALYDNND